MEIYTEKIMNNNNNFDYRIVTSNGSLVLSPGNYMLFEKDLYSNSKKIIDEDEFYEFIPNIRHFKKEDVDINIPFFGDCDMLNEVFRYRLKGKVKRNEFLEKLYKGLKIIAESQHIDRLLQRGYGDIIGRLFTAAICSEWKTYYTILDILSQNNLNIALKFLDDLDMFYKIIFEMPDVSKESKIEQIAKTCYYSICILNRYLNTIKSISSLYFIDIIDIQELMEYRFFECGKSETQSGSIMSLLGRQTPYIKEKIKTKYGNLYWLDPIIWTALITETKISNILCIIRYYTRNYGVGEDDVIKNLLLLEEFSSNPALLDIIKESDIYEDFYDINSSGGVWNFNDKNRKNLFNVIDECTRYIDNNNNRLSDNESRIFYNRYSSVMECAINDFSFIIPQSKEHLEEINELISDGTRIKNPLMVCMLDECGVPLRITSFEYSKDGLGLKTLCSYSVGDCSKAANEAYQQWQDNIFNKVIYNQ